MLFSTLMPGVSAPSALTIMATLVGPQLCDDDGPSGLYVGWWNGVLWFAFAAAIVVGSAASAGAAVAPSTTQNAKLPRAFILVLPPSDTRIAPQWRGRRHRQEPSVKRG